MAVSRRYEREPDSTEVILRNGQSLRIRPISRDDMKRMEELFYRLSPRTRYLRFQYAKNHITEEELKYFTEMNPPKRVAYVATVGEGAKERIVAVGRWDMLPDEKTAEIAFTVEDNIQLKGIGTALLEKLAEAAYGFRISCFEAHVLLENARMMEVFDESGFKIQKHFREGVYDLTIDLTEQEEYAKRQAFREHIARSAGVKKILSPERVAVIGASRAPDSVGGALFRNILNSGFKGTVFPVNPKATAIAGVMAYPSILDVPGDIDLAVIVVPAPNVLDVIDMCGEKGVRGVVIISAGFAEAGPEGKERERKLKEKVLSYGMRVVGPNCLGVLNNTAEIKLNSTFSPVIPSSGNISIGSQSGALGLALLDHAKSINLGISHFVSIGNRMDISSNDLMEYWEDDESTQVVLLYLESFGNPRKFSRIARRLTHKKPVIAVKAGKSIVGARAATSHTGALAAADIAVDAMFRQAGVIRVNTIEEMFNAAEVLGHQPLPQGNRVGILTNAGGPGVLAADACEGLGLKVATLSDETQAKLREFLPKEAATANPVDMIATAPPSSFGRALRLMLDDDNIDSIVLIYIPPLVTKPSDVAGAVKGVLQDYKGGKPVITCFMMSESAMKDLRQEPGYQLRPFVFPEDAVSALAQAYNYSLYRKMEEGVGVRFPDINPDKSRESMIKTLSSIPPGGRWLMPDEAFDLIESYGIPVVETRAALGAKEAVDEAREIGFPVVMKVRSSSPRILHKTDIGGIYIGLKTGEEVMEAYEEMSARLARAGLEKEMQGVIIQPVVRGLQEMIAGMSLDPVFGPLVMLGFGGIQVELIKDVAFSLHPLRNLDPERMLRQLKSLPLLEGWRGRPLGDIVALKEVLLRFSLLIEDFPEIADMEINPLFVNKAGDGCMAVDIRIFMKSQE